MFGLRPSQPNLQQIAAVGLDQFGLADSISTQICSGIVRLTRYGFSSFKIGWKWKAKSLDGQKKILDNILQPIFF